MGVSPRSRQATPVFLLVITAASALAAGCAPAYHTFADRPGFREFYADRCRDTPPAVSDTQRDLLERFRPVIILPPGGTYPIDFYRDYLPYTRLVSFPEGRVLEENVSVETLRRNLTSREAFLDLDRKRYVADGLDRRLGRESPDSLRNRPPVVYGRVYEEDVTFPTAAGSVSRRLTFLKYNLLFATSGLPWELGGLSRFLTWLSMADPEDWHELDNFVAVHVVLDERQAPVAVILAQHNHHRTYLAGRDIFAGIDGRFAFDVARRSNEIYPASGSTGPVRHRVIRWSLYLDYLLSGKNGPRLKAWDVTEGIGAGGRRIDYKLRFLSPCDPLYTSQMLLGETRSPMGIYLGRDGPPGSDYYNIPRLLPLGNLLKFAYLHDGDLKDIEAVRSAVDLPGKKIDVMSLMDHGGRRFYEDWSATDK